MPEESSRPPPPTLDPSQGDLLVQLQGFLASLNQSLQSVKEEREVLRREIAEIKGVLLGGAVSADRPVKIRVEDNEAKLDNVIVRVRALEARDNTSKTGLIWAGLAIAASSGITGLVVWLLARAGAG